VEQDRLDRAVAEAEQIVRALGLRAPIDPLEIVKAESPFLKAAGADLKGRYDGQLEYHPKKNRFLLFFNTKYDQGPAPGRHHPRTRFSISHELGHYYLAAHRAFLMRTGMAHPSSSELRNNALVEREADAFASGVLLPTHLFEPVVNEGDKELTAYRVQKMAEDFQVSYLAAVVRAVRLSRCPCGVVGIRDAKQAWSFVSPALVGAGGYPRSGGQPLPKGATRGWARFSQGDFDRTSQDGKLWEWFETYEDDDVGSLDVYEEYVPIPSMKSLVVLITADPKDVNGPDDDDESEEEEYTPSWKR
jgi:Zn-dependent peptidase ImmA (M78 family)